MGDGFTVVGCILRGIGDNVTLFERGGVNRFHEHQIARIKVRLAHGVGQNNNPLIAEQITVGTVKGGYRNNGALSVRSPCRCIKFYRRPLSSRSAHRKAHRSHYRDKGSKTHPKCCRFQWTMMTILIFFLSTLAAIATVLSRRFQTSISRLHFSENGNNPLTDCTSSQNAFPFCICCWTTVGV